jgi:hypothetical protein
MNPNCTGIIVRWSLESQFLAWFEINDPLFVSDQIKKKEKQWARFYGNMIYI